MIKKILLTVAYTLITIIVSPILILIGFFDVITEDEYSKRMLNIWESK